MAHNKQTDVVLPEAMPRLQLGDVPMLHSSHPNTPLHNGSGECCFNGFNCDSIKANVFRDDPDKKKNQKEKYPKKYKHKSIHNHTKLSIQSRRAVSAVWNQ